MSFFDVMFFKSLNRAALNMCFTISCLQSRSADSVCQSQVFKRKFFKSNTFLRLQLNEDGALIAQVIGNAVIPLYLEVVRVGFVHLLEVHKNMYIYLQMITMRVMMTCVFIPVYKCTVAILLILYPIY